MVTGGVMVMGGVTTGVGVGVATGRSWAGDPKFDVGSEGGSMITGAAGAVALLMVRPNHVPSLGCVGTVTAGVK